MGYPPNCTAALLTLGLDPQVSEQRMLSLLGNAWHLDVTKFWIKCHFGAFMQSPTCLPTSSAIEHQSDEHDTQQSMRLSLEAHLNSLSTPPSEIDIYLHAISDVKYVIDTLAASCPYTADRKMRGLNITEPLGPDWAEHNAARSVASVSGVQAKHQGYAASHQKLVPYGLPAEVHIVLGEAVTSPLDLPVVLPDDLDFACRFSVKAGTRFANFQRSQVRLLRGASDKLHSLQVFFDSRRTTAAIAACSTVRPHVLDLASRIMRCPDVSLPWLATVGVPIVGNIPPTGIFRDAVKDNEPGAPFAQSCELWVQELLSMPPPKKEQLHAVWEKCVKEQDMGILGPWHSAPEMDAKFGKGAWRPLKRFAVFEAAKQKWRAIDNGRSSGHNDAVDLFERIHTTSTEMGLAVA